ncbi:MAG: type II toxin-antitoxin system HipA family toxin [Bacteroidota bacterium]|nr:type II toxin-antitoxin system HipA family toxin [Bacteroidota bacterium]
MITTAFINIWGNLVGAIAWNSANETASFEYDPSFKSKGLEISPIKMPITNPNAVFSFPELRNNHTFKGLPGLLADVMPDKYGNAIINAWLQKNNRPSNSMNPIEMLCFIGNRGMGALEFSPNHPKPDDKDFELEINSLVQIAEQILQDRQDFKSELNTEDDKHLYDLLKIGTSAGGARAKAVIAFNPQTKQVRSGQAEIPEGFEHWLIKFDGVTDTQFGASSGYGRVEMAYFLMAQAAGITMQECQLFEENGRAHFMTKRFDRVNNEKLHMQSFCGLQHYDFNEVNSFSYEQLFETMRLLGLPYTDAQQLFTRMVFNVMARNCEDHTKNFAFLMDKSGVWRLSPAFDICHAYRPNSPWVSQHALSIEGKRTDFTVKDFVNLASKMNIKKPLEMIEKVRNAVGDWHKFAKKVEVDKTLAKAIENTLLYQL